MDTIENNQTGSLVVLAGLVAGLLGRFNISVTAQDILTVGAAVMIFVGVIKQAYEHKKVVIAANAAIAKSASYRG